MYLRLSISIHCLEKMADRIFDLASGDSDRIASKQFGNEFRSMPPAFLAGMYVTEPFNANRVANQVTSLL